VEPPSPAETVQTAEADDTPELSDAVPAEEPVPAPRSARLREWSPVLLIFLGALALRLWGITWSLPDERRLFTYHPDEGVNLTQGVLERGAARPHLDLEFYNYGGLYFYLWQGAAAVNSSYGIVMHSPGGEPDSPTPNSVGAIILVGRLLSALFGAATCLAVFVLGNRLFGRNAGLFAAALYAVMPAAVVHAHYATVDATATFFVMVALAFGARLLAERSFKDVVKVGLLCGLAGAAKYNVILVAFAPFVALVLSRVDTRQRLLPRIAALAASVVGGFVLGCAGLLVNWNGFVRDFSFELAKSQQGMGALFADTGNGWVYHLASSLRLSLGIPLLLLCLAAVAFALLRRSRGDLYLFAFFVPYYLVIGWSQVRFLRYVLPILPVLALLVGRLLAERWPLRPARWVLAAAGAGVGFYTLTYALAMDRMMTLPDPRDQAADFISQTLPPGTSIGFVWLPWYYTPPLDPAFTAPSPGLRRSAALANTRYRLVVPGQGKEWDPDVLAAQADAFTVSQFEIEDSIRLNNPAMEPFYDLLGAQYQQYAFVKRPVLFGIDFGEPNYVPNDWLYINPTTTVWVRKRP
jgi:4-amino-4-deoxy-L-arabinose transferase-like glycosyltransferase